MNKLETTNAIDFLNIECKNNKHKLCNGNWVGLGFIVGCNCSCHQHKNFNVIDKRFGETISISEISKN